MAGKQVQFGPAIVGILLGVAYGLLFVLLRSLSFVGDLLEIVFICGFGYMSLRYDPKGLLYLCASSIFVLTTLGQDFIFPFAVEVVLVGLIFGYGLRRKWSFGKVLAFSSLPSLAFAIFLLISWPTVSDVLKSQVEEANRSSLGFWEKLGVSGGYSEQAQEAIQETVGFIVQIRPALNFLSALIMVVGAYVMLRKLAPGLKIVPPPMRSFREWRIWEHFIWAFVAGMALWIFGGKSLQTAEWNRPQIIGWNLIVVMAMLYLIQGFAITFYHLKRVKVSPYVEILFYVFLIFTQVISGPLLLGIGVLDTWFDFRKVGRS